MSQTAQFHAQCACGQMTIDTKTRPLLQLVCHCTDCRNATGDPFTEVAFFAPGAYTVHGDTVSEEMPGGTGLGKVYFACKQCNTPMYATVNALSGSAGIIAGRLSDLRFRPALHVWTSEKTPDTRLPLLALKFSKAPPTAAGSLIRSVVRRLKKRR